MDLDTLLTDVLLNLDPSCSGIPLFRLRKTLSKRQQSLGFADLRGFLRARPLKYGLYNGRNHNGKGSVQMVVYLEGVQVSTSGQLHDLMPLSRVYVDVFARKPSQQSLLATLHDGSKFGSLP
jgi:hypothetical protein